jgi:hypothetical protein
LCTSDVRGVDILPDELESGLIEGVTNEMQRVVKGERILRLWQRTRCGRTRARVRTTVPLTPSLSIRLNFNSPVLTIAKKAIPK